MKKFILTNDDGIMAAGMEVLFQALEGWGERIVVAPMKPCSGSGHTLTTHKPIPVITQRENWHAVGGTPADCSRLALTSIAPGVDWLFSGVNRGGNLGADVYNSGTAAGAREAALLGYPSLAVSQYFRSDLEVDWGWTLRLCRRILPEILGRPLSPGAFWNVNLPHLPPDSPDPPLIFCKLDFSPLEVQFELEKDSSGRLALAHFRGNYHNRPRKPGRDVDVCFGGSIAVTEVPLDITA